MADHRLLDPAARLRLAREQKGLSPRQVAEATKLSVRAIEMLERDCLSGLPAGIYRRSIIRAIARDVRLMAAQGSIAPRPLEQLGILMVLTSDGDGEIRDTAEATLKLLPPALLAGFIARADIPTDIREFFIRRGIEPGATPTPDTDEPLIDTDETGLEVEMARRCGRK